MHFFLQTNMNYNTTKTKFSLGQGVRVEHRSSTINNTNRTKRWKIVQCPST